MATRYERLLARADRRMYRNKAESKTTLAMGAGARGQAEVVRAQLSPRAVKRLQS